MAGDIAYSEAFGVPEKIDPLTTTNKAGLVARFEDAFAIIDAAGLCVFLMCATCSEIVLSCGLLI